MQRHVFSQRLFSVPDLMVCLFVGTAIFGLVSIGREWRAEYNPVTQINLSLGSLAYYTLLSGIRGLVAYLISLSFTLVVGYAAAKSRSAERVIIPMIDILQSIPVLGFLPGLLLGLVALFPRTNTGLELAAILMIFTGQVWNMTFSYYSSLKSVPSDLSEASTVIGLGWGQRLRKLELPFAAVNLAWNSLMSMAGGWFFLSVCESSKFGTHEYRLPGIGAYMSVATAQGDRQAIVFGILAMVFLIVIMDFVIWRPILSWVQRFRLEDIQAGTGSEPLMAIVLRESKIMIWLKIEFRRWRQARREEHQAERKNDGISDSDQQSLLTSLPLRMRTNRLRTFFARWKILGRDPRLNRWVGRLVSAVALGFLVYCSYRLFEILVQVTFSTWVILLRNTLWTFLRVMFALAFATLWAVPVGIWLGTRADRLRIAQPIIQILASFPAPMLYPLVLSVLFAFGVSFDWGSMLLMLLGVQWYVLFNVLAGAMRVPRELKYALELMETPTWLQWRMLYIPSVFPTLVTGWVTAAGGAWNASMVAEAVTYRGQQIKTGGLGATIQAASDEGNFVVLAASLTVMVFVVILMNRLVWAPLYRLAQTRFKLDV